MLTQKPGHSKFTPGRTGVHSLGGQHALPVGDFTTVREHGGGPKETKIFGSGGGKTPVDGKSIPNRGALSLSGTPHQYLTKALKGC